MGQGPLQEVVWSKPNGLAYVQDNNVYYVPNVAQPNVIATLTTEGVPVEVYYGTTDWIYEGTYVLFRKFSIKRIR